MNEPLQPSTTKRPQFIRMVRNNIRAIEAWNTANQRAMDANWLNTHCEVCHIRKRDQTYRRCWACRKQKRTATQLAGDA